MIKLKKIVIIPAFNEEKSIVQVVDDIKKNKEFDLIVVNDCSKDNTERVLIENDIPFLNLAVNLGIGGAVQAGYIYARENGYDIAVQMDGDGQHDCRYLKCITAPIEQGNADICIGSRFINRTGFQSSTARRVGISFLSYLINLCTGYKIKDVTSGFRAINREMIEFYADDYPQDYPEPEAIVMAARKGAIIKEVAVEMKERTSGKSSINTLKSVYYMIKVSLAIVIERAREKGV